MADEKKDNQTTVKDAEIVGSEKKKSNKMMFIIIPVLVILGITAGIFLGPLVKSMFGGKENHGKEGESSEKKDEKSSEDGDSDTDSMGRKKPPIDPKLLTFIPIPDVLVNLKTAKNARPIFLKVGIELELHNPKIKEDIEALKPKVIDQMQLFLRDLDVADVTGANNLQRVRRELYMRINNVTSPYKVDDVLIKDFLIQ